MTTPKHPYTNPLPYTLTTWRECVIWCALANGGGVREVGAMVYGVFALHYAGDGYALTHIPTGKRVMSCVAAFPLQVRAMRLTLLGDWNTRSVGKLVKLREAL